MIRSHDWCSKEQIDHPERLRRVSRQQRSSIIVNSERYLLQYQEQIQSMFRARTTHKSLSGSISRMTGNQIMKKQQSFVTRLIRSPGEERWSLVDQEKDTAKLLPRSKRLPENGYWNIMMSSSFQSRTTLFSRTLSHFTCQYKWFSPYEVNDEVSEWVCPYSPTSVLDSDVTDVEQLIDGMLRKDNDGLYSIQVGSRNGNLLMRLNCQSRLCTVKAKMIRYSGWFCLYVQG